MDEQELKTWMMQVLAALEFMAEEIKALNDTVAEIRVQADADSSISGGNKNGIDKLRMRNAAIDD